MIIKIIPGFVSQVYDDKEEKCVSQKFIQNENEYWKDDEGNSYGTPSTAIMFPPVMIQPPEEE